MKNLIYTLLLFFTNISLSQNLSLYEYVWHLDKFIINGEDITYTDQNNYFHYLVIENNGSGEALIKSGFCEYVYGMFVSINDNQFTVGAVYETGYCDFNNADTLMNNIGNSFYNQGLLYDYVVSEIGTNKQLIITNTSNDVAIYNNVNLGNQNQDKVKNLVVYPNPTKNKIYFSKFLQPKDYKIYSIDNRLMKTSKIFNNSIDMSELPIGTYIIEYLLDDKIIKNKIIKE